MPRLALLIMGCGLLGLLIGSFLNVVIHRIPLHLSVVRPRSSCPHCGALIRERDNIPVISWILLRGRCRNCGGPISVRYLLVELSTGALFAGAAARVGFDWYLPALLALFAGLFALAVIDFERMILPKPIVYATLGAESLLLVLAAVATGHWHRLVVAGACALAWFVLFFVINLASPRVLGFGDVRLSPVLGLGLGWLGVGYVVVGFFLANFIGAVIGLTLIATRRMDRSQPVPYGVFLAMGTAAIVFIGPAFMSRLHLS